MAFKTYQSLAPMIPAGKTQISASQIRSPFSPRRVSSRSTINEATTTPIITITPYQRNVRVIPNISVEKITGSIMYTSRKVFADYTAGRYALQYIELWSFETNIETKTY